VIAVRRKSLVVSSEGAHDGHVTSTDLHPEDEIQLLATLMAEGEHIVSVETDHIVGLGWDLLAVTAEGETFALARWMPTANPVLVERHRRLVATWLWAQL